MRILFVTSKPFIPDHFSGPNRTLLELAAGLARSGHEPVVLAGGSAPPGRPAVASERMRGLRLLRTPGPADALATVTVTLRPDLLVIFDGDYEALIAACGPLDIPLAAWFFHVEPYFFRTAVPQREVLWLAGSRFVADRLAGLFGLAAAVVPPFVERRAYRQNCQGNRVLFVNPVQEKGVELAFALAARRPDVPFTFVESWGLPEPWRKRCFERALRCGNIEWLPRSADMAAVFRRTRLLLVPRFSEEGYCRLVTEAQLGGVPALVSNRGGLAETVGPGGTALDIDAGVDTWLERLDLYLGDDGYHRSQSLRARAHAERPGMAGSAVAERLLGLLQSHLKRVHRRPGIG